MAESCHLIDAGVGSTSGLVPTTVSAPLSRRGDADMPTRRQPHKDHPAPSTLGTKSARNWRARTPCEPHSTVQMLKRVQHRQLECGDGVGRTTPFSDLEALAIGDLRQILVEGLLEHYIAVVNARLREELLRCIWRLQVSLLVDGDAVLCETHRMFQDMDRVIFWKPGGFFNVPIVYERIRRYSFEPIATTSVNEETFEGEFDVLIVVDAKLRWRYIMKWWEQHVRGSPPGPTLKENATAREKEYLDNILDVFLREER
ncbi:predicted protein [Postia placenta Mad-698-R]|nr:predicted protein [Postia placenta Mad-698-R]